MFCWHFVCELEDEFSTVICSVHHVEMDGENVLAHSTEQLAACSKKEIKTGKTTKT
jgi:hypothetical protein